MALTVKRLSLVDWRNARDRTVELSDAMTVLVGPNGCGKTNAVEALQLLTAGVSFRRPTPAQLVREGAEVGRAQLEAGGDGRVMDVTCTVSQGSRRFTRNGKPVRPSGVAGELLSVLFTPDDLDLVKRSASVRRDELDGFGSQASPAYRRLCRDYGRAVEQRNRVLKGDDLDVGLLDAWDLSLASLGGALLAHRRSLWEKLGERAREVYAELAPAEPLGTEYHSSIGPVDAGATRADLEELLGAALAESRERDLARRQTTVGPHRDDPCFTLSGRSARDYGSQGQQRTAVLAWKLAQVRFCEEHLGRRPLLLLDDVMSELDEHRRAAVSAYVDGGIQTVVTTTHLGYFDEATLARASVVPFERSDDGDEG